MYKLPLELDLSFFIDKELSSLHFATHSLILHFDDELAITTSSSMGIELSLERIVKTNDFRQVGFTLLSLIGSVVISAMGDKDGTLKLTFSTGTIVSIYDDSDQYESYTIQNGESLIVV